MHWRVESAEPNRLTIAADRKGGEVALYEAFEPSAPIYTEAERAEREQEAIGKVKTLKSGEVVELHPNVSTQAFMSRTKTFFPTTDPIHLKRIDTESRGVADG